MSHNNTTPCCITSPSKKPEEHQAHSSNRSRPKRYNPISVHFDHLFGPASWSRFLIIRTQHNITAAKLENLLLQACPSRDMTVRKIDVGEWLIQASTKQQSESYLSLTELDNIDIVVRKHKDLNSIEGTVVLPSSNDHDGVPDEEMILSSLKLRYPNVQSVTTYQIPSRKSPSKMIRIARVRFEGQDLPQDIRIEGQRRELLPYIPKPLQCHSCSKYGHTKHKCRSEAVCAFCSSKDHRTTWNCGTAKCVNCGLGHHARSKECVFYIFNAELKLLMSRSGMSINEAKQELRFRGFKDPAKDPSYRTVITADQPSRPENPTPDEVTPSTSTEDNKHKSHAHAGNISADIELQNSFSVLAVEEDEMDIAESEENPKIPNVVQGPKADPRKPTPDSKKSKAVSGKSNSQQEKRKESPEKSASIPQIQNDKKPSGNHVKQSQKKDVPKKPVLSPKATQQPKRRLSRENSEMEEISPSPVFTPKQKPVLKKPREDVAYASTSKTDMSLHTSKQHHNRCGCHDCFEAVSAKGYPLTMEKLAVIIRNFIEVREKANLGALKDHPDECMCVNHLLHYKRTHTKIMGKYIEKKCPRNNTTDIQIEPSTSNHNSDKKHLNTDASVKLKEKSFESREDQPQDKHNSSESLPSLT